MTEHRQDAACGVTSWWNEGRQRVLPGYYLLELRHQEHRSDQRPVECEDRGVTGGEGAGG
jgi:hypothetical protein